MESKQKKLYKGKSAEELFQEYSDKCYPKRPDNAFKPSEDDHLLVQPKKLQNPVLQSHAHQDMQKELKMNQKLGINVLKQKSELTKVFEEKKLKKQNPKQPSGFDLAMKKRRESLKEREEEHNRKVEHAHEYLKAKGLLSEWKETKSLDDNCQATQLLLYGSYLNAIAVCITRWYTWFNFIMKRTLSGLNS